MKRILTLFMLVAMTTGMLPAGNVSPQMAQRIGAQFLSRTQLGQQRTEIQLQLVSTAATRGEADYYVFNVSDGEGFVIVAGDDRVKPILAYSTTGSYDPEDVADGFAFTLNGFRTEIQYVREHNLTATADIVAEWRSVAQSGSLLPGRQVRAVVGPLCQTIWNQNYPYNSQCPEDPEGNGGYVYAGCVATAMGQVMKFWDYPEQGIGSHTYNPDGYAPQTANFGETDYHFELMPLALDSTSTEEEIFYIAQFLHHCGIAVDMQYSGHGSGAYSFDVPTALSNYFGYSTDNDLPTLSFWGFNFYTNEQWIQMLKDGGLDEGMPLYYSGSDDNGAGGHAFVCDGYDENDYFHFNWGWSGRDDAWCPIGALNTTKYAFNDSNSFLGHIVPNNGEYFQRADSVANMNVMENGTYDGVTVSWTNPELNLNGEALTSIESVTVRRNFEVVATLTGQPGQSMSYQDENLAPGLYEYAIFVTNAFGISRTTYRSILVGEKCDITFQLHDDGGDGWKGAAISVTDENGARIAIVTMTEGSDVTVVVPLLKQNLNFIWNHGWYHTNEQYDTDYECSFTIYDGEGNELFTSSDLEDGVFMTYENNCEEAPLACYPVQNLQGEYQWHNDEEFGALLSWERPDITFRLSYFQIMKTDPFGWTNVVEVLPYTGDVYYEYFDTITSTYIGENVYTVVSIYLHGDEVCASESERLTIMITGMDSFEEESISVYPNPTSGLITIENPGSMRIVVSNLLGQKLIETVAEDNASVDLGSLGRGVYLLRVETANGTAVQKVSVQ